MDQPQPAALWVAQSQQLRNYFIAERFENLSDDELYVLERDSQGKLKYPEAYQKIVDQAVQHYHTKITRPLPSQKKGSGRRPGQPLSGT